MENAETSTGEGLFDVVCDCIDNIYSGDEVFDTSEYDKEEMIEFVNSLTNEQFEKLKIFFGTMPAILHDIEFTCSKCGCSSIKASSSYLPKEISKLFLNVSKFFAA